MHPERRLRLSKFLSLILRHRPEQVGLTLDPQGRVLVEALVPALASLPGWEQLTASEIEEVALADTRRFELTDGMIRARYGHSISLAQPGPAVRPPEWLYFAAPPDTLDRVRQEGLLPGQRSYVHLCEAPGEAARILERHNITGQVITVLARRAHDRGLPFFRAADRLYLATRIPVEFLHLPAGDRVGSGRR